MTSNPDDRLIDAIKRADCDEVVRALKDGANPNTSVDVDLYGFGGYPMSALQLALTWSSRREAKENYLSGAPEERVNVELVKALIDAGADIHQSMVTNSPFHTAVQLGHLELVAYMLDRGADANFTTGYGQTVLHAACIGRHLALTKLLLERGANPNLKFAGKTPLEWVTDTSYLEMDEETEKQAREAARLASEAIRKRRAMDRDEADVEPDETDVAPVDPEVIAELLRSYGAV